MPKSYFKDAFSSSVNVRKIVRWIRASTSAHPDWSRWATDQFALNGANGRSEKSILLATSTGAYWAGTTVESVLAAALKLRHCSVHTLLCDELLPACLDCVVTWFPDQRRFAKLGPQKDLCPTCYKPAATMYEKLGVQLHRYSDYVSDSEAEAALQIAENANLLQVDTFEFQGIRAGEHAKAGALRFFARGNFEKEPLWADVLKRYLRAAILTVHMATRLFRQHVFDVVVLNHGIYVPQGIIAEVARKCGVNVVTWNPAYRKHCFIFSHDDTYHHTLMSEPTNIWEEMEWDPRLEDEVQTYLKSRWTGSNDWIWFHEHPEMDLKRIHQELGIDPTKPCIGMLSNVVWDAQLHYPANAFPNMLDWIFKTLRYFEHRPDLQLVLRIHPAEIRGTVPSRQHVLDEVNREFPVLPSNIFVIPPESQISTYAAMLSCDTVLIYGTKMGVELTSMGVPVIVAGEAWIRNKGISIDAESEEDYYRLLDKLPRSARLSGPARERALKYAYHFFFRRMIPLRFLQPTGKAPPFRLSIKSLEELMPGMDDGLDCICDGILKGTPFIYLPNKAKEPLSV